MKAVGDNKLCSKCKEWKHVSEFHNEPNTSDGKNCRCISCRLAYMRARSQDPVGKEQMRVVKKRARQKNISLPKVMVETKFCTKCNIEKHATEFGKRCDTIDGLSWHCKECARTYRDTPEYKAKMHEAYLRHKQQPGFKEKCLIYARTRRESDPTVRVHLNTKAKEWYHKNIEKARARNNILNKTEPRQKKQAAAGRSRHAKLRWMEATLAELGIKVKDK